MALYLYETKSDWSGPVEKIVEEAYYGPFPADEIEARFEDPQARFIEALGNELEIVELTDEEASEFYINPPEWWHEQTRAHSN